MNRTCNGDLFSANGKKLYRCLLDSAVVTPPNPECSNCGRIATPSNDYDECELTMKISVIAAVGESKVVLSEVCVPAVASVRNPS